MTIALNFGIEGYFNLVVRDSKTLKIKRETGFFKNIITDYGLNRLGSGGIFNGCSVGSGTSTPSATDTQLQSQIARTTTILAASTVMSSGAPYYTARVYTYRFPEGAAAGNLSEVGINAATATPFQLWSRALIVDGSGNPTTITVFSNEVLDVVYECRVYAMESDVTGGPITLLGTQYNWTLRARGVTSDFATSFLANGTQSSSGSTAYTGAIGPVTAANPSGSVAGASTIPVLAAYSNNSYKRQLTITWTIAQGNSGGIQSIAVDCISGVGPRFQIGFDKSFPKGPTNTLSVVFEYSWARRSI